MMRCVIQNGTWGRRTHWRVTGGMAGCCGDRGTNGYPQEVGLELMECCTKRSKEVLLCSGLRQECVTGALHLQIVTATTQVSPSCGAGLLAQRGLQIFKHSCKKILKGLCFLFKNLTPNHFSSRSALQEFLPVNILLTLLFYGMNSPILKQIELRKFQSLNHLSSLSPERHAE